MRSIPDAALLEALGCVAAATAGVAALGRGARVACRGAGAVLRSDGARFVALGIAGVRDSPPASRPDAHVDAIPVAVVLAPVATSRTGARAAVASLTQLRRRPHSAAGSVGRARDWARRVSRYAHGT